MQFLTRIRRKTQSRGIPVNALWRLNKLFIVNTICIYKDTIPLKTNIFLPWMFHLNHIFDLTAYVGY